MSKQHLESEQARRDLKKVLEETAAKSRVESEKLHQYQDILLKENQTINSQMIEMRQDLTAS